MYSCIPLRSAGFSLSASSQHCVFVRYPSPSPPKTRFCLLYNLLYDILASYDEFDITRIRKSEKGNWTHSACTIIAATVTYLRTRGRYFSTSCHTIPYTPLEYTAPNQDSLLEIRTARFRGPAYRRSPVLRATVLGF